MSLATILAAEGMRPASFLPAIKCSSCAMEIEIAAMGDHICSGAPPAPQAQLASVSNQFTIRQMNAMGQRSPTLPLQQQQPQPPQQMQQQSNLAAPPQTRIRAPTLSSTHRPATKPVRTAPPRINADAANYAFLAPKMTMPTTPVSPAISARSGSSNGSRPRMPRSATSPMPDMFDFRPPSPELTGNMDCAFPSFPTTSSTDSGSRPGTSNGRKTPTSGGRAPSRAGERAPSRSGDRAPSRSGDRAPSRSGDRAPSRSGDRAPSRSGERAPSRTGSRPRTRKASGNDNPQSPMSDTSDFVRQRTNTLKSGSTDMSRGSPVERERMAEQPGPLDRRRPSLSGSKLGYEAPPMPTAPLPSTAHTNYIPLVQPTILGAHSAMPEAPTVQKRVPPPRPGRPDDNAFSGRFIEHLIAEPIVEMPSVFSPMEPPMPLRSTDRSRTFPLRQESVDEPSPSQALQRTPSEPPTRSQGRRPTLVAGPTSEASAIPHTQNPSRSFSRTGRRVDLRLEDAPPVPSTQYQYAQETAHASSGSDSSTASSLLSAGNINNNGGQSPMGSAASSVDTFPTLTYDQAQYAGEEKMRVAGLNIRDRQKPGMRAEQRAERSPPRSFARPSPPRQFAQPVELEPIMPGVISPPLESPMDPAMFHARAGAAKPQADWQWSPSPTQPQPSPSLPWTGATTKPGLGQSASPKAPTLSPALPNAPTLSPALPKVPTLSPILPKAPQEEFDPYRPVSPQPGSRTGPKPSAAAQYKAYNTGSSVRPLSPRPAVSQLPVPQQASKPRPSTPRAMTVKPSCRGCGQVIEGKSVKAADGRLTGRWHKACFNCRACEQPFTTADFYVLDDQPYCEQHYHEQNGSLCHGCHRGIEGQYLETISRQTERKFHPRCFTCCDCRQVLSDDYFEISGKVYCERHALAAMRGQARMAGPGLKPPDRKAMTAERRTTKLMMM